MGILNRTIMTELDNGVRLCYFHRRGSSVEFQFHVLTGSIHEGEYLGCGLSHFLEHMAFQGCAGFPERLVCDIVNQLGGDVMIPFRTVAHSFLRVRSKRYILPPKK